jgi:hypothetical protein
MGHISYNIANGRDNSNHILSSEVLKAFVASRTAQLWNREVSPHANESMWQFCITFLLGLPRGFVGRCIHTPPAPKTFPMKSFVAFRNLEVRSRRIAAHGDQSMWL